MCELLKLKLSNLIVFDMNTVNVNAELVARLREFIEVEARSGSMEPALITAEYVFRMWGGAVSIEEITAALSVVRGE